MLQKLGNPEDDLSEVGAWLDERKSHLLHLNRELHELVGGLVGNGPLPETSAAILLPSVIDWPALRFRVVELEAYVPMPRRLSQAVRNLTGLGLRLARALGIDCDFGLPEKRSDCRPTCSRGIRKPRRLLAKGPFGRNPQE